MQATLTLWILDITYIIFILRQWEKWLWEKYISYLWDRENQISRKKLARLTEWLQELMDTLTANNHHKSKWSEGRVSALFLMMSLTRSKTKHKISYEYTLHIMRKTTSSNWAKSALSFTEQNVKDNPMFQWRVVLEIKDFSRTSRNTWSSWFSKIKIKKF